MPDSTDEDFPRSIPPSGFPGPTPRGAASKASKAKAGTEKLSYRKGNKLGKAPKGIPQLVPVGKKSKRSLYKNIP